MPGLRRVIGVGGAPAGWADWHDVLEHAPDPAAEAAVGPETVNAILFTSGTTARPKGAMHTHRTALVAGAVYTEILGLGPGEVLHHGVPFFTSSGAQGLTMMMLWSGCTMVVEPVFDQSPHGAADSRGGDNGRLCGAVPVPLHARRTQGAPGGTGARPPVGLWQRADAGRGFARAGRNLSPERARGSFTA